VSGISTFRDLLVIFGRTGIIPFDGCFEIERFVREGVVVLVDELCERCLEFLQVAAEDPEVEELPDDVGVNALDVSVGLGELGGKTCWTMLMESNTFRRIVNYIQAACLLYHPTGVS